MVVKNYKEMCKILEEKECAGNSKKSQLKRWSRYFSWKNEGYKFIIEDIFLEPLEVVDLRVNNRAIYIRYIEWLLAQDLSKREGYTHTLTKKRWWYLLGMVNRRYLTLQKKDIELINPDFTDAEINWFFNRCYYVMNNILRNALNSMRDRCLLDYEMQTIIVRPKNKGGWFQAGPEEIKEILNIKKEILKEYGINKESKIFAARKQDEFYKKVYARMYESFGWERYYKQIKIIYDPESMKKAIPEIEEDVQKELFYDKIIDNKLELNQAVLNRINTDAKNKYNIAAEKKIKGESKFSYPSRYLEIQFSLAYWLINLKSMDDDPFIEEDMENFNEYDEKLDLPQIDDLFYDLVL